MTIAEAFDVLQDHVKADPEYAWSWHCNFAVPIMDSTGVTHEAANKAAASLMRLFFGVDTTANPHYQYKANANNG